MESSTRSRLVDYVILRWMAQSDADSVHSHDWNDEFGLSPDDVATMLTDQVQRGYVSKDSRLAGVWYVLEQAGRGQLAELSLPNVLKRLRSAHLRDAWIDHLYAQGATGIASRCHPADHFEHGDFLLGEPTRDDHEFALSYLEDKGLIHIEGSAEDRYLFVWLTTRGIDCAEQGNGVSSFSSQPTAASFVQHNTFSGVVAAAAGRDHVSATGSITLSNSITNELRTLVEQINEPEDREEGLVIIGDAEDAANHGDESKFKVRLRQLRALAGRLGERGLAVAIESAIKPQLGS